MEPSYVVQVLEQCRISPPSGSVSTISIPLTFFDLGWVGFPPIQRLFFYEFHHSKVHFINTALPNIKHSLSLTLQHFFPLAGNLTWPQDSIKPEIMYMDGDTISLTVSESDYDFYHLLGNQPKDTNELYPLVPQLVNISDSKLCPLMALQVTLFPNKGICIGVTYQHSAADGRTLIQFVKSWASVSRLQGDTSVMTETPLCYDRTIVNDPYGLENIQLNSLKEHNITKETFNISRNNVHPTDKVLATFVMRHSDIQRLKQWVSTRMVDKQKQSPPLHLSTFVVTCGYVWVCLLKARWGEVILNADEDPKEYFAFPVDSRARLDPPLPTAYFGNCLKSGLIEANRNDLIGADGIVIAAELIREAIKNIDDLNRRRILKDMSSAPDRVLSVAGSTKLGIYETDFGWGNPKKAEVISIATTGAISLSECPSEIGSVEVGLVRNKIEMDAFTSFFANTIEDFPRSKGELLNVLCPQQD